MMEPIVLVLGALALFFIGNQGKVEDRPVFAVGMVVLLTIAVAVVWGNVR